MGRWEQAAANAAGANGANDATGVTGVTGVTGASGANSANGAANAAHLAAQILALADPELTGRMNDNREAMRHQVRMKDAALQEKLAQSGQ